MNHFFFKTVRNFYFEKKKLFNVSVVPTFGRYRYTSFQTEILLSSRSRRFPFSRSRVLRDLKIITHKHERSIIFFIFCFFFACSRGLLQSISGRVLTGTYRSVDVRVQQKYYYYRRRCFVIIIITVRLHRFWFVDPRNAYNNKAYVTTRRAHATNTVSDKNPTLSPARRIPSNRSRPRD